MKKIVIIILAMALGVYAFGVYQSKNDPEKIVTDEREPGSDPASIQDIQQGDMEIIAQNLKIPWEIVFLPDGNILVTERPGTVKKIGQDGFSIPISGVKHIGEGGLLGMTLHPDFSNNNFVYLYYTYSESSGRTANKVVRYKLENNRLSEEKTIIDAIPGSQNHNGGRIKFSPDGFLFVTTGDSENSSLAQNTGSLAGKILRVRDDGSIPEDNPFGNAVWSYGHRNVQGLTWDSEGRFWATEHGRSGALSGYDELNLIKKGANYGWPEIQGSESRGGMETPIANSGATTTWAPSGATYYDGSIFFSGLRGQAIYEYKISENSLVEHYKNQFGRIRNIVFRPDGNFYLLTNNTDGRGQPRVGDDDKIIKFSP